MKQFTTQLKPCSLRLQFKCEREGHRKERKRYCDPRKEKDRYATYGVLHSCWRLYPFPLLISFASSHTHAVAERWGFLNSKALGIRFTWNLDHGQIFRTSNLLSYIQAVMQWSQPLVSHGLIMFRKDREVLWKRAMEMKYSWNKTLCKYRIFQHCEVKTSMMTPTFYYIFIVFLT